MGRMALQRNFFSECVAGNKERTVVIISDAMRYEVGAELAALLAEDPKSTVQLTPRLGVLPSCTRLGMAALLPHTRMEMTPEYQVLIDDMPCENLTQRQAVLQKRVPQSGCIQFDDLKAMKKTTCGQFLPASKSCTSIITKLTRAATSPTPRTKSLLPAARLWRRSLP